MMTRSLFTRDIHLFSSDFSERRGFGLRPSPLFGFGGVLSAALSVASTRRSVSSALY